MVKPKYQPYVAPENPSKIIGRFIFRILSYPYSIVRKYNNYNIRVGELVNELKDDELNRIRFRNAKLLLVCIYLPLMIGLGLSSWNIFNHYNDYVIYGDNVTHTEHSTGLSDNINKKFKKVKIIVKDFPVQKNDIIFLLYAYGFTLVTARFLSLHGAFKEEEKIISIFASLGYTNAEGDPWEVTWTPDAVQIIAFNCDPIQLCGNTRFWSSINFPPGTPKVSKTNMNKFIVTRAYELPPVMLFSFDK